MHEIVCGAGGRKRGSPSFAEFPLWGWAHAPPEKDAASAASCRKKIKKPWPQNIINVKSYTYTPALFLKVHFLVTIPSLFLHFFFHIRCVFGGFFPIISCLVHSSFGWISLYRGVCHLIPPADSWLPPPAEFSLSSRTSGPRPGNETSPFPASRIPAETLRFAGGPQRPPRFPARSRPCAVIREDITTRTSHVVKPDDLFFCRPLFFSRTLGDRHGPDPRLSYTRETT